MQLDAPALQRRGIFQTVVENLFARVLTRLRHDGRLIAPLLDEFIESAVCLQLAPFYLGSTEELSDDEHRKAMVQLLGSGTFGALFDPLWCSSGSATPKALRDLTDPVFLNSVKERALGLRGFVAVSEPAATSFAHKPDTASHIPDS